MSGRDFSAFLGGEAAPKRPALSPLAALGWQPFFAQQTDVAEMAATPPVRVTQVHRSGLHALGDGIAVVLPPETAATVGDWVLWNAEFPRDCRVLDRKSAIKRRAPGKERRVQLIAANLDVAFIVTSCNADFNVARLERYIALAFEAEVTPVIVLTKADLCADPAPYLQEARAISEMVDVVALDARGAAAIDGLAQWCKPGQTVAFLGSSGVGKSTLTNALAGNDDVATQGVREADAKGRHTTTHRHLHFLSGGCAVLDTPGMRELQMTDAAAGVGALFKDFEDLAAGCKFRDCAHETEPGCQIRAAIAAGDLDEARLARWKKLVAEDAFNSASLSDRRAKDKQFGRVIKEIQKRNKK